MTHTHAYINTHIIIVVVIVTKNSIKSKDDQADAKGLKVGKDGVIRLGPEGWEDVVQLLSLPQAIANTLLGRGDEGELQTSVSAQCLSTISTLRCKPWERQPQSLKQGGHSVISHRQKSERR